MTLRQALNDAAARLSQDEHLAPTANRDAELLLLHALQISRVTLLAHPGREITADQQAAYERSIVRRRQQEPIQYITGEQEFYSLLLNVTSAVLIPRPETEHLVEAVLKLLPPGQPLKIADVGTGSGAIAIALAVHLPQAKIAALDLSPDALAVATANAAKHDVAGRINFLHSDLLNAILPGASGQGAEGSFDAIVSNPPYIPISDHNTLHPQVREHEPHTALFAGEAGLDIYQRLIPQAWKLLKPNGLLALEIGHGQQQSLTALLAEWNDVSFIDDLQRIPRVALAKKSAHPAAKG